VTIEIAIKSPLDIFRVLLAGRVLSDNSYHVHLNIRYLLGARMDRPIDKWQPDTLALVRLMLQADGPFHSIRVLDVHNPSATIGMINVLPFKVVKAVYDTVGDPIIIVPDKGAVQRVEALTAALRVKNRIYCEKTRDVATGKITGFKILNALVANDEDCLIIDDICDGGATFTSLAMGLKDIGAKTVNLYVTHGIFSKGFKDLVNAPDMGMKGQIDRIFTTDSYRDWHVVPHVPVSCIPVRMENM
jgi:ribose-phosphate pyrophosphokinase